MGVTGHDIGILTGLIQSRNIKRVLELGAQNNYEKGGLPAPYMREWYESKGIIYDSIDLTGECGALKFDLGKDPILDLSNGPYDMVTDFGTSEHVSDDGNSYGTGKFSWEAIYNCWKTKFNLCKQGGIIFSVNPETGNWPGHGFQYYTKDFYVQLSMNSDLRVQSLGDHPAMGNFTDGWNVYCILEKYGNNFPPLEVFKTFDLRLK